MSSAEGRPIRVLHVDDEADLAEVVALHLERSEDDLEVVTETSARDGLDRLAGDEEIHCVVSDHDMPGMDGLEFLRAVRERHGDLPFILFTGKGSEEIASEAISAGVTEYLQKATGTEQYTVLAHRIERAVSQRRAQEALEESERMFSTLVENLPGMVYRCRMAEGWPMDFVSDGCEDLTGYTAAEIESGEVSWGEEVIHPEDREPVWEPVESAIEAENSFELTYRIRTKGGETRWVWERGCGVYRDGELAFLEGFITDVTERRRREDELAREREFTERVLDAADDAFYVVDPETGEFLRWSDSLGEKTGYTDAELEEMTVADLVADDHLEKLAAAREEALETGSVEIQTTVVPKEGEPFPVEFRGSPLYDADGDLVGIGGVGRDVTERVEREHELEQYRELVENVGDPMYVLDPDGEIRMVNRAMASHLGYDRAALVGETPDEIMPAEDVERSTEILRELLRSEDDEDWRTWEMDMIRADGTRVRSETKTTLIYDDGEFAGSVGVIRDVSDRVEREQELARYETVLEAVGDPVYALDAEGTFTFVNEAIEPLTGYAPAELVGEHVSTIVPAEDVERGREHVEALLSEPERRALKYEIALQPKDGEPVPCEVHIALLPPDEDGAFRGTAGIVRDITERKRREKRLAEFASVVSHDLRNPLHVIQARSELALETGETEHVEAIADAAETMESMIVDLLSLARQGEAVGETRPVAVEDVVGEAWATVETGGADLVVGEPGEIEADPARLRALFENLFRNAIEHAGTGREGEATTDGSGDGAVRAGADAVPGVRVRVDGTDDGFYVADDGPGIPPDEREAVFERGYTTTEDGTGFGLAIVSEIARAHGWSVTVAESEWGGARFEFAT